VFMLDRARIGKSKPSFRSLGGLKTLGACGTPNYTPLATVDP